MRACLRIAFPVLTLVILAACQSQPLPKSYPFTGKVLSIDLKEHTAAIDGAAVPNYMDAMKMDYPIASDKALASLKVGENISATIQVSADGSFTLVGIHEAGK